MAHPWKPSVEDYDKCNRQARREGIFAGATGGLFAAVLGQHVLRFNRNKTLFAGLLTGVLSGYYFSQAFLSSHLSQLRQETIDRVSPVRESDGLLGFEGSHERPSAGSSENGQKRVV